MHFGIKDLIDVLLVAFFLYQTYKLMKARAHWLYSVESYHSSSYGS